MIQPLYKRIELRLPDISVQDIQGSLINDYGSLKNFRLRGRDSLESLIHKQVRFHIPPHEFHLVEISGGVDVHTDGVETGLCYYLDTDGSITRFWQGDDNKSRRPPYIDPDGKIHYNGTKTWHREDLIMLDSFQARNGECYLMNVKFPHSVEDPVGASPRYLLKWHWDHNFDTVADSIELL